MLPDTVEIGSDHRCADVGLLADLGITQIRQVADDRPGTEMRLLDLDEGADFNAVAQDRAVAEMCMRTDVAPRSRS